MEVLAEKTKLYGHLIREFINAFKIGDSKIEDSGLKIVEIIQKTFELPIYFVDKPKEAAISFGSIGYLNHKEKKLCRLAALEKDLRQRCKEHFRSLNLEIEKYDFQNEILTFSENENHPNYEFESETGAAYYETHEINIKHMDQFDRDVLEPWLCKEVQELFRVRKEIFELKEKFPEERTHKLIANSGGFRFVELFYERSSNVFIRIYSLLLQLHRNQKIDEESSHYYGLKYIHNEFLKIDTKDICSADGSYLDEDLWLEIYEGAINSSFFLFFSPKEHWKLVHKCKECEKLYIAKSLRSQRWCSNRCRLKFHNRNRIASGEAREYKRRKRKEGAKKSYYG